MKRFLGLLVLITALSQNAFAGQDVPSEIAEAVYKNLNVEAVLKDYNWVKEVGNLSCLAYANPGAAGYECKFLQKEIFEVAAEAVTKALPVEAVLKGNIWYSEYKNILCLTAPGRGTIIHKCVIQ